MAVDNRRTRFGKALRALRLHNSLTQAALAGAISKDQAMISDYEMGQNIPDHDTVIAMEHALAVPAGTLSQYLGWIPADPDRALEPPEIRVYRGVIPGDVVRIIEDFVTQLIGEDAGTRATPSTSLADRLAELEKMMDTFVGGGGA